MLACHHRRPQLVNWLLICSYALLLLHGYHSGPCSHQWSRYLGLYLAYPMGVLPSEVLIRKGIVILSGEWRAWHTYFFMTFFVSIVLKICASLGNDVSTTSEPPKILFFVAWCVNGTRLGKYVVLTPQCDCIWNLFERLRYTGRLIDGCLVK